MNFRCVILWILLALLPLRGWAMGDMQVSMATGALTAMGGSGVAVSSPQGAHEMQAKLALPCHGEVKSLQADDALQSNGGKYNSSDNSTVNTSDNTTDDTTHNGPHNDTHSACNLCDLCHSVAMTSAEAALKALPAAAVQRLSFVSADTGLALIDRLDRPPRSA